MTSGGVSLVEGKNLVNRSRQVHYVNYMKSATSPEQSYGKHLMCATERVTKHILFWLRLVISHHRLGMIQNFSKENRYLLM